MKVINDARQALYRFCNGKQTLSVPARDEDDDFLISKALDEFEKLLEIVDRARKIAMRSQDEDEDYDRPRFKMDANGNLTRIEEE
jgi:prespore-specific regulator